MTERTDRASLGQPNPASGSQPMNLAKSGHPATILRLEAELGLFSVFGGRYS